MSETSQKRICPSCGFISVDGTIVCPNDAIDLKVMLDDHMLGKIVADRYKVISVLGRGGMSVVYKAHHQFMDRLVAIKMIRSELDSDSDTLKRLQIESQAISALKHPNIVPVYDFGLFEDESPYLVMEFLEGRDLDNLIKENAPMSYEEAIPIFISICNGLEHAHQNGIVHRDIKPGNIIMALEKGEEVPVIVDFGIAKIVDLNGEDLHQLTATGQVFGSPLYMSPEQCGAKRPDARSDIYAVGCVMYQALTGRVPLKGNTPFDTMIKHIQEYPKPFSEILGVNDIPTKVELCVFKALEKDPDHRFQSIGDLANALSNCLGSAGGYNLRSQVRSTSSTELSGQQTGQQAEPIENLEAANETSEEVALESPLVRVENELQDIKAGDYSSLSDELVSMLEKGDNQPVEESDRSGKYGAIAILVLLGFAVMFFVFQSFAKKPLSPDSKTELGVEESQVSQSTQTDKPLSVSEPINKQLPSSVDNEETQTTELAVNSTQANDKERLVDQATSSEPKQYSLPVASASAPAPAIPVSSQEMKQNSMATAIFKPAVLEQFTGWKHLTSVHGFEQRLADLSYRSNNSDTNCKGFIFTFNFSSSSRNLEQLRHDQFLALKSSSKVPIQLVKTEYLSSDNNPMHRVRFDTIEFCQSRFDQYRPEKNPRSYIVYSRTTSGVMVLQVMPVSSTNYSAEEVCKTIAMQGFDF